MASPVGDETPAAADDAPSTVAEAPAPVVEDMPAPVANIPASSPMPHALAITPRLTELQAAPAQSADDPRPTTSAEPTIYVVQTGDNLTRLSARFGTTIPAILGANKIANPSLVFVGQSLIIPTAAPKPDVVESPAAPAPIANHLPQQVADAPDAEVATTYTVKPGDSAITIARKLGVNVDDLLATNAVVNRNRVYVGQVLTVPEARS